MKLIKLIFYQFTVIGVFITKYIFYLLRYY